MKPIYISTAGDPIIYVKTLPTPYKTRKDARARITKLKRKYARCFKFEFMVKESKDRYCIDQYRVVL